MLQPFQRKLTAILHADVAGYSRLTGEDEEGTHRVLRVYLPLIAGQIESHGGRVVHYAGDAVLAEFATASDALQCAVDSQNELAERNEGLPEERRVLFRMGVNLGEVIVDPPEIYGEGVNVAARLEGLADPGGIAVSEAVRMTVGHLLPVEFEPMGEHEMKNIGRPVRVYRVLVDGAAPREAAAEAVPPTAAVPPKSGRNKLALVVLPLTNKSSGEEDAWLAEGITEDLTIELSRFKALLVIGRHTAETYAGRSVDARILREELDVDYVVTGSVRRAGPRVRVTVTLTDTNNGRQVWAERYDRQMDDVFELQDEITRTLVSVLPTRLEAAALEQSRGKSTDSLKAYEYLLRGRIHHHRGTPEDNATAQTFLDRAVELDPTFAQAYAWKACVLGQACVRGFADDLEGTWKEMIDNADRSSQLGGDDSECARIVSELHLRRGQFDQAEQEHDRAFQLNPNDPRILCQRGEMRIWRGRPEEALEWIDLAMRLDPRDADRRAGTKGWALMVLGRYDEAVALLKRNRSPQAWDCAILAAASTGAGDAKCAAEAAARTLESQPDFTVSAFVSKIPFENSADAERIRDLMLAAGLPA